MRTTITKALASLFCAIAAGVAAAQTVQTPISDFINGQTSRLYWTDPPHNRVFFVDYAGLANDFLIAHGYGDLGTAESGTVTQRKAPGGRLVHVDMQSSNCLCLAEDYNTFSIMYFGYTVHELLNDSSLEPAIGSGHLTAEWTDSQPVGSSNMPDLAQLVLYTRSDQHVIRATFEGDSFGPLRSGFGVEEGTPGMVHTTQIGLPNSPQNTIGGFNGYAPTEKIEIKVVG